MVIITKNFLSICMMKCHIENWKSLQIYCINSWFFTLQTHDNNSFECQLLTNLGVKSSTNYDLLRLSAIGSKVQEFFFCYFTFPLKWNFYSSHQIMIIILKYLLINVSYYLNFSKLLEMYKVNSSSFIYVIAYTNK